MDKKGYARQFSRSGGKARAAKLSKERRSEIARQAAVERWRLHRLVVQVVPSPEETPQENPQPTDISS